MKKRILGPLACAALLFSAVACSDNDGAPVDPAGTVVLNMLDELNGKTLLAEGIYIDEAQNFVADGTNYDLFALGRAGGLGGVSPLTLDTPARRIAAEVGCGYAAVPRRWQMQFPSGAVALEVGADEVAYLKMYVVSQLAKENKPTGAVVRYVAARPADYGLPASGGTALEIVMNDYPELGAERILWLPTDDFEYVFEGDRRLIVCEKRGNGLVFSLSAWQPNRSALYVRVRESYVKVFIDVVP